MAHIVFLSLALLSPPTILAADTDAKALAQDILTKGAALFDTRNAAAMAATYTEDAEITLFSKDKDTGHYKAQVTRGRTAIEQGYQEILKNRNPGATSRNIVEYARFAGPSLLIIHGTFALDDSQGDPVPFVQVRAKKDDKWLIMSLQLFVVSE
jgi:hypothetical protein